MTEGEYREGVILRTDCWRSMLPIALRDASLDLKRRVLEAIELEQVDESFIPVCNDTISAFRLATIVKGDPDLAILTAEAWMTLPLDQRVAWNPRGDGRDAIHGQILGRVGTCSPILANEVPRLLPALLHIGNWTGLQASVGVQWQCAVTSLGQTCMALPSQDSRDACLIVSDCPVSYGDASDPRRSLAAVEILQEYLEACEEASDDEKRACGWDPTSHEALEMHSTINQWHEQIARW